MSDDVTFEKALERLEAIVGDLESGEVKLEEALKKYEEGVRLARQCQNKLEQAERKIEVLNRSLDGTLRKQPFDLEEEAKPAAKSKHGTSKSKIVDGDILI